MHLDLYEGVWTNAWTNSTFIGNLIVLKLFFLAITG